MKTITLIACASLSLSLAAQKSNPDHQTRREIKHLSAVIQQAVDRVAPSIVTVETFGGARRKLGQLEMPNATMLPDQKQPGPPGFHLPEGGKPWEPKKNDDEKKQDLVKQLRGRGFIQAQGAGTGLIVGADGWIVTSRFQLNWLPSSIIVTLHDGRKFTARMVGQDLTRGFVMLKVDAKDLPVPQFVPQDEVQVGQWAFALGRSFGPERPTVNAGIISARYRIGGRALQCDAMTSPANYGGPLIDIEGRVLGLVAPLSPQGDMAGINWYDSGIGFASSLSGISDVFAKVKAGKTIRRGMLGIRVNQGYLGPGAKIVSVTKRTAADHAKLRKGDVILEVDGQKIHNSMHLQYVLSTYTEGDFVDLVVVRKADQKPGTAVEDAAKTSIYVQLDERKPPRPRGK